VCVVFFGSFRATNYVFEKFRKFFFELENGPINSLIFFLLLFLMCFGVRFPSFFFDCFFCLLSAVSYVLFYLVDQSFTDGDWICQRCNYHNFARRVECKQCHNKRQNGLSNQNNQQTRIVKRLKPLKPPRQISLTNPKHHDSIHPDSFLNGLFSREVIEIRNLNVLSEEDTIRYSFASFAPVRVREFSV